MSKIEIGRWSDLLRRVTGQAGSSIVAAELSPEISPVIVLEERDASWDYLKGVRRCAFAGIAGPAVGFSTRFRLRNPVGSGVMAVIEQVWFSASPIADVQLSQAQIFADYAVGGVTMVPDLRWGAIGVNATALTASSDVTNAAGIPGTNFWASRLLANTPIHFKHQTVIAPGSNLEWGTPTLNVRIWTTALWTERNLPRLEQ